MKSYLMLLPFVVLVGITAVTGARFMPGEWYAELAKPSWTPPNWLFGPAWTILYIMIAIAGWRVWLQAGAGLVLAVWLVQLAFNMAWSWIMFGEHKIGLAFADIMLLWLSILAFIVLAWPVDRVAAWLFIPYLAWVSYAATLNFAIWRLNPTAT
jgi:translocator protein